MPIQTLEFLSPLFLENDFDTKALQSSLKQFIDQFLVSGCGLFHFCCERSQLFHIDHWAESASESILAELKLTTDWQQSTHSAFEVLPIEGETLPYPVYRCLLRANKKSGDYLVCWHSTPLSDHQKYGLSLYAKSLELPPVRSPELTLASATPSLEKALQCTRHQLRTPLALILLYVNLLKTTCLDPRSQEWLEHLSNTAESMNISLEHLTTLHGKTEQSFSYCNLGDLIAQCHQEMEPWIAEKRLKLVCNSPPLWLWVDKWKIKQVFQNLLSNAIAFSPEAGQIRWEWQTCQTEVLIKISDQGPGLSPEDLRLIGTPFYSRRTGGTGLGLSIAKQVISAHQGSLSAVNLLTGGAQFCIMLPKNI
ncbi:sensor histidine kinase [Leptolyngbyaceae cyanobacterium UHCC 1019]